MTGLGEDDWDALEATIGPLRLPHPYVPVEPTAKQEWFLRRDELEAFFGGSAGPGKSWGLLMAALQYVDLPDYHALLVRPALTEFEQSEGLIEVSHEWLDPTDAWWNGTRREWAFPSGATLRFGYLANLAHVRRYKGAAASFVGFDELTSFPENLYRAMFRMLRQAVGKLEGVPLRMRGASNPGDIGHDWVKTRFIDPASREAGAVFVPATIHDNPHLDYDAYLRSLAHLSPVDRERLIRGDWDVMEEGGKFNRADFRIIDETDAPRPVSQVRYWDLAATEPSPANLDPDWTVGLLMSRDVDDHFTIRDVHRFRLGDERVEQEARQTAEEDGPGVAVWVEQEPGASGKLVIGHWRRKVLAGYAVHAGLTRGGDKEVRSRPVAAAVANGMVRLVRGRNTNQFLSTIQMFPSKGVHDDDVDALSGAHTALTRDERMPMRVYVPKGRVPTPADRGTSGRGW